MGGKLKKSVIVGIDVGTTTGIAILDARGNLILLTSKRYRNKNELIKEILRHGKPVIVASDVNPAPKNIERIAKSFGARLFYPEKSLTNLEKERIIKKFKEIIKSSHQKDALAACLKAFKKYRSLFLKIDEISRKMNAEKFFDEIVSKVIERKSESIVDVIREIKSAKS
ncbi:MAG TPA: DUF460 domain-containing protein [Candidatus Aenigmarchaeota archaeon]|nr:DUF460 domain-containing protein [Candidatus Aenigmarchaeota archaeon]